MAPITKLPTDLYQAQATARGAVHKRWLPVHLPNYVEAQKGVKKSFLRGYTLLSKTTTLLFPPKRYKAPSPKTTPSRLQNALFPLNPLTGRRQFLWLPRKGEKALGDWIFYPLATRQYFETSECFGSSKERIAQRVAKVAKRVIDQNQSLLNPPGKTAFNYRVKTLSSDQLNAFSIMGGGMAVFSQLVKELEGAIESGEIETACVNLKNGTKVTLDLKEITLDDALAALIGHESTHAAAHHTLVGVILSLIWAVIVRIQQIILPNETVSKAVFKFKEFLDNFFSRGNEYECDVAGAYMTHRAKFNVLGAIYLQEFFSKKESEYGSFIHRHFEFMATHPHSENRKRALFAAIGEFAPKALFDHIVNWTPSKKFVSAQTRA